MKCCVPVFFAMCIIGCSETSVQEQPKPWFENEAEERGFAFVYESGFNGTPQYPEIFGGGAALLDIESDGDCHEVTRLILFSHIQLRLGVSIAGGDIEPTSS